MCIRRVLSLIAITLVALMVAGSASAADRVEHRTQTVPFTFVVLIEGEEAACLEGADRLILSGTDVYKITEVISGPNAGSMHVILTSEGTLQAFTGATLTATGTVKAMLNFKFHRGDRRLNFAELVIITTSSGEPVKYTIHYHFTVRDGELTREILKLNCIQ